MAAYTSPYSKISRDTTQEPKQQKAAYTSPYSKTGTQQVSQRVGKSMSQDLFNTYDKEFRNWSRTGKYSSDFSKWSNQQDIDTYKAIKSGQGRSAFSNGNYYYLDNDTYDRYGREYYNWNQTNQYNDISWMNQDDLDAFKAIRGNQDKRYSQFDDFRYGLDDDVLTAVGEKYKSQWGDKYYYDMTDPNDVIAQQRGEMPYYLRKQYNMNDPIEKYLYDRGLPNLKNFSDMYSDAYQERQETQQKEYTKAVEEAQAKQDYQNEYNSFLNEFYSSLQNDRSDPAKTAADLLTSGRYDNVTQNFTALQPEKDMTPEQRIAAYNKEAKSKKDGTFTINDLMENYNRAGSEMARAQRGLMDKQAREMGFDSYADAAAVETEYTAYQEYQENASRIEEIKDRLFELNGYDPGDVDLEEVKNLRAEKKRLNARNNELGKKYNNFFSDEQLELNSLTDRITDLNKQITMQNNIALSGEGADPAMVRERDRLVAERYEKQKAMDSRHWNEMIDNLKKVEIPEGARLGQRSMQNGGLTLEESEALAYQTYDRYMKEGGSDQDADTSGWSKADNRIYNALMSGGKLYMDPQAALTIGEMLFTMWDTSLMLETGRQIDAYELVRRTSANMTDEERSALRKAASQGEAQAHEFMESLISMHQMRTLFDKQNKARDFARDYPATASLVSLPLKFVAAGEEVNALKNGLLKMGTTDALDEMYDRKFTAYKSALTNTVSEEILRRNEQDLLNTGYTLGQLMNFSYQTGMSMAESLETMFLGPAGLAITGLSAASSTMTDLLEQGATSRQATFFSIVAGAAEYVTEKVSLDALFSEMTPTTWKQFFRTVLEQSFVEGSEELASDVINTTAEYTYYMLNKWIQGNEEGMEWMDFYNKNSTRMMREFLTEAGASFAGGAVSGGLFAGGNQALSYARAYRQGERDGIGGKEGVIRQRQTEERAAELERQADEIRKATQGMAKDAARMIQSLQALSDSEINRDGVVDALTMQLDEVRDFQESGMSAVEAAELVASVTEQVGKLALDAQEVSARYRNRLNDQMRALERSRDQVVRAAGLGLEATVQKQQEYLDRVEEAKEKRRYDEIRMRQEQGQLHDKLADVQAKWTEAISSAELSRNQRRIASGLADVDFDAAVAANPNDPVIARMAELAKAGDMDGLIAYATNGSMRNGAPQGNLAVTDMLVQNYSRSAAEQNNVADGQSNVDNTNVAQNANKTFANAEEDITNGEQVDNGRAGEPGGEIGSETELSDGERGRDIGGQAEWSDETGLRTGARDNGSGDAGALESGPAKSWLGVDHTQLFKDIARDFNRDRGLYGRNRIKASDFEILTEPTNQRSAEILSKAITRNGGGSVYLYRSTNQNAPNGFVYKGNIYINDTGDGLIAFYYAHEYGHSNRNDNAIQKAGREVWDRLKAEGSTAFERYCERWNENPNDPKIMNEFISDIRGAYEYAIQNNRAVHDQLGLTAKEAVAFYREFSTVESQASTDNGFQEAIHEAAAGNSGETNFNYHSMSEDRAGYRQDLLDAKVMPEGEVNALFDTIDSVMDIVGKNRAILDFFGDAGKETRAYKPYKKNADPHYKLALDFSTLCRKRVLLQSIAERLQAQLGRSISPEETVAIRNEIKKYKEAGKKVEVACALCYVEAARLKSPKVINKFLDNRQQYMTDYFAKKNSEFMTTVHEAQANFKVAHGYAADATKKQMSPADVRELNKLTPRLRSEYQPSAEEAAIIEKAVTMPKDQYLSASNLTKMAKEDPQIYDAFITAVRSATRSKAQESAVPYFRGDVASVGQDLIDEMNEESGFRHQSWSDFEIIHMLDNIAAVIELSTRGAKVHAYTKVPAMVVVNGNTGMMLNMSEIPAGQTGILNENVARMRELIAEYGEAVRSGADTSGIANQITEMLTMDPVEGMPKDQMVALRDKYHATAGNIMIGINDLQIRALLASELIDYVIPYHTSGLNKKMRERMGIKAWQDYTAYQNEKANGRGPAGEAPRLNEWFNINEAKNAPDGVRYMQEASQRYLDLCSARNLEPKFTQFLNKRTDGSYELADDALNYWKLLTDRKMVDQVTGRVIEQQKILPKFNKGDLETLLQEEIADPQHRDDEEVSDAIVQKVASGELKVGKADREEARRLKELGARVAVEEAAKFSSHQVTEPGSEYKYDHLVNQDPMEPVIVTDLSPLLVGNKADADKAADMGIKNARSLANGDSAKDGSPIVVNRYNNQRISVTNATIHHGIGDSWRRATINARLGSVIGELVRNGIPLNDVEAKNQNDRTYVIGAYGVGKNVEGVRQEFLALITVDRETNSADGVDLYDIAHSVNGKVKRSRIQNLDSAQGPIHPASNITIKDFLDLVNEFEPSILSKDVYQHFGYTERPNGYYKGKGHALYSSHNLQEGANVIEDTVIRNARAAQDLYNSGVSVADYMAHGVYDPEVARQLGGIQRRNAPTGLTREQRAQMYAWDRDRLNEQMRNMKAEQMFRLQNQRQTMLDRQDRTKYMDRVIKTTKELADWVQKPDFKAGKYVPDFLLQSVTDTLSDIDYGSESREGGQKVRSWRQRMSDLNAAIARYQAEGEGYMELPEDFSANFQAMLDKIPADAKLQDMTASQLKDLSTGLTMIRSAVRGANKLHANGRYANVAEVSDATIGEMDQKKTRKAIANMPVRALDNLVNSQMLDMYSYANRLGPAGETIFKAISDGFFKGTTHVRDAQEFMEQTLKDVGVTNRETHKWSNDSVEFTTEKGEKLALSTGQIMELYALSRRPQGMQHILGGGIQIGTSKAGKDYGNYDYQITSNDLDGLFSHLTDKQKRFTEAMQNYLSTVASGWGNEVSQKLYGVDMYNEDFYWPIKSARNNLKTQDPEAVRAFNALMNASFTNSLNAAARNAITVNDAVQTFCDHVSQMANYSGMAIPISDAFKWFNYRERDGEGHVVQNRSVKQSIERTMGKTGLSYFVNLMKDINGLSTGGTGTELPSALVANTKAAAVAGKLRVVIQQPTAIVRAMALVNPNYFVNTGALNLKKTVAEMQKYAPIAWWKDQGNFDIGTGNSIRQILVGDGTTLERIKDVTMKPAGLADNVGWATIWEAVKKETAAREKGLDTSSEEYFRKVADRFTDVINKTQVIDTILHRSEIMRSKDSAVKQATAFMAEPIKTFNMLHNAVQDVIDGKQGAKLRLGRTAGAVAASWVLNSVVLALHDALRDREEGEELAEKIRKNFTEELLSNANLLNDIPYVKDVLSMVQGYSVDRMDMTALSDMIVDLERITKAIVKGESNYTAYGLSSKLIRDIGSLTGLPVEGLWSTAETLVNGIAPGTLRKKVPTKKEANRQDLYEKGLNKKDVYYMMANMTGSTNAEKALQIVTSDRDGDGTPDFSKREQDIIAEVLGFSGYTKKKDKYGSLEQYGVQEAKKKIEKEPEKADIFETYFDLLGVS